MKLYTVYFTQCLPLSLDEAWAFFSTPKNLAEITPSWLRFEILSEVPDEIHSGLMITYRIRPIAGIPLRWVTEITEVEAQHRFIDEQRSGPYRLWQHTHAFNAIPGGVKMQDLVLYAPKPPLLSGIVNALFVQRQVQRIFRFRKRVLAERFGEMVCPEG